MGAAQLHHMDHPEHEKTRKSLISKLDWHVLPGLSLLWLACFIDRTNIGNAKVGGMDRSLGLHGKQYNIGLALFYVTYIIAELPSNYMLKKVGGKLWLPFLVASWGFITIFAGFMKNFASLIAIRMLLGLFEGGLLPGMVVYLSTMYKRDELQLRVGIFFASASLSGAFGGLLAYGIERMEGVAGQKGWQWVFILEGIGTVIIAVFATFYLPTSISKASFLTPIERAFAVNRMKMKSDVVQRVSIELEKRDMNDRKDRLQESQTDEMNEMQQEAKTEVDLGVQEEEKFEMYEVIRAFKEPQVWMTGIGYMSVLVGMYSYSLFLPSIIVGMGYKGTTAQLFSSFPYLPASVLVVLVAFMADKLQRRGPIVIALLPLTMIGYILAIVAESNKVRYVAVFFMAAGIYPSVPAILCILPNNTAGTTKRSTCTALQLMLANCAGFIATFIYTSDQAPKYKRGHTISLSFTVLGWFLILSNILYCMRENRLRKSGKRQDNLYMYFELVEDKITFAPIGDRSPEFLMTL